MIHWQKSMKKFKKRTIHVFISRIQWIYVVWIILYESFGSYWWARVDAARQSNALSIAKLNVLIQSAMRIYGLPEYAYLHTGCTRWLSKLSILIGILSNWHLTSLIIPMQNMTIFTADDACTLQLPIYCGFFAFFILQRYFNFKN